MGDSICVDVVLEFLKRNKLTEAEAALRNELCKRPDLLDGILQKVMLDDKEVNGGVSVVAGEEDKTIKSTTRHGAESLKSSFTPNIVEPSKAGNEKKFVWANDLDACSWASSIVSGENRIDFSGENRINWPGCIMHRKKSSDQPNSNDDLVGKLWSRSGDVSVHPSSECCVKTVVDKHQRKAEVDNIRSARKDEAGRALFSSHIAKDNHFKNESDRVVKTMEKMSHVWEVKNYSATKKYRVGQSIRSDIIKAPGDGDFSFRIYFYPLGETQDDYIMDSMSVSIVNESRQWVDIVSSVDILESIPLLARLSPPLKRCRFSERLRYREISRLAPHVGFKANLYVKSTLDNGGYVSLFGDSIKIEVIIGVFRDQPLSMVPQPFDPFVFIEVGEWHTKRFYVNESVLKAHCPELLPPNHISTEDIVVKGIDISTFEDVLWYMNNGKLHREVEEAILNSNRHDPYSDLHKMLAAAHQLKLGHLIRLTETLVRYGSTFLVDFGIFGDIYRALRKCGAKADEVKVKQKVIKTESSVTRA